LAIINFITISIAKSSASTKEIGVRKIAGSNRFQLIKLFIVESVILTFIAAFLALIIVYFLIRFLMKLPGKKYFFHYPDILQVLRFLFQV